MIFELVQDFAAAISGMPKEHPRFRILKLLDEAIRRDMHFIDRHLTTLFQCMWNTCWWYDTPASFSFYSVPEGVRSEDARSPSYGRHCLHEVLEQWRAQKESLIPGFRWLRTHQPPLERLGNPIRVVLTGPGGIVNCLAFSSDGQRLAASGYVGDSVSVWDVVSGAELVRARSDRQATQSVAFHSGTDRIAAGTLSGTVMLWNAQNGELLMRLEGHEKLSYGVAFTPDGKRLASVGHDQTVRIWDVNDGHQIAVLKGHQNQVRDVDVTADGKWIATVADDYAVRIWDGVAEEAHLILRGHHQIGWCVRFSPEGDRVAAGLYDGTIRVWDTGTGTVLQDIDAHDNDVTALSWFPDGRKLASCSRNDVCVWDFESGRCLKKFHVSTDRTVSIAVAPDGKSVAVGYEGGQIRLWEADGDSPQVPARNSQASRYVKLFPGGDRACSWSGLESLIRTWDVSSGQERLTLAGASLLDANIRTVDISRDGRFIAGAGSEEEIRIWFGNDQQRRLMVHPKHVHCAAFSPDGKRIATGSKDNTLRISDVESARELFCGKGHKGGIKRLAYSPDGKRVATASLDKTLGIWDLERGAMQYRLKGHEKLLLSVAWSPDGNWIASGSLEPVVRIWDAKTGRESITLHGHEGEVRALGFSIDSQLFATGSADGTVRLWAVENGWELGCLRGHTGAINAIAFSPNGKYLATGGDDRTVRIWRTDTGEIQRVLEGRLAHLETLAWSVGGTRLVSSGERGDVCVWDIAAGKMLKDIRLGKEWRTLSWKIFEESYSLAAARTRRLVLVWDAHTGQEVLTLANHAEDILCVCFSPDGSLIASGSRDGTVSVTDVGTGNEVCRFAQQKEKIYSVAFSPDGNSVVTGCGDGTVRIWNASTGDERVGLSGHAKGLTWAEFALAGMVVISWSCGDYLVKISDAETGSELSRLNRHAHIYSARMSSDGRFVATQGDPPKKSAVWDVSERKPVQIFDGLADLDSILPEARTSSWIALSQSAETVIVNIRQHVAAWLSIPLAESAHHPNGRVWIGTYLKQVVIVSLEGEVTES